MKLNAVSCVVDSSLCIKYAFFIIGLGINENSLYYITLIIVQIFRKNSAAQDFILGRI